MTYVSLMLEEISTVTLLPVSGSELVSIWVNLTFCRSGEMHMNEDSSECSTHVALVCNAVATLCRTLCLILP
jgi:hypothetical protein